MRWMRDFRVNNRSRLYVKVSIIGIAFISRKQTNVMSFLNNKERNLRLIIWIQSLAGVSNGLQLEVHHLRELSFTHSVSVENNFFLHSQILSSTLDSIDSPVEDDSLRLMPSFFPESSQLNSHNFLQVLNYFRPWRLQTNDNIVLERLWIVTRGHLNLKKINQKKR